MADQPEQRTAATKPTTVIGAAAVLLSKGLLGVWGAYALFTATPFIGEEIDEKQPALAVLLLVLALLDFVVVWGLLQLRTWARGAGLALQVVAIVLSATRIGSRPTAAIISIMLSVIVIAFLLAPSSVKALGRSEGTASETTPA